MEVCVRAQEEVEDRHLRVRAEQVREATGFHDGRLDRKNTARCQPGERAAEQLPMLRRWEGMEVVGEQDQVETVRKLGAEEVTDADLAAPPHLGLSQPAPRLFRDNGVELEAQALGLAVAGEEAREVAPLSAAHVEHATGGACPGHALERGVGTLLDHAHRRRRALHLLGTAEARTLGALHQLREILEARAPSESHLVEARMQRRGLGRIQQPAAEVRDAEPACRRLHQAQTLAGHEPGAHQILGEAESRGQRRCVVGLTRDPKRPSRMPVRSRCTRANASNVVARVRPWRSGSRPRRGDIRASLARQTASRFAKRTRTVLTPTRSKRMSSFCA
jgi:hypothetical protein